MQIKLTFGTMFFLTALLITHSHSVHAYTIEGDHALYAGMDVEPELTSLGISSRGCPDWSPEDSSNENTLSVKKLPGLTCQLKVVYHPFLDKVGRCTMRSHSAPSCSIDSLTGGDFLAKTYEKLISPEDFVEGVGKNTWEKKVGSVVMKKATYEAGHTFYEFLQVIPRGAFDNSAAQLMYESLHVAEVEGPSWSQKTVGPITCIKRLNLRQVAAYVPQYRCEVDGVYTHPVYVSNPWKP